MGERLHRWLRRLTADEEQLGAASVSMAGEASGRAAADACAAGDKVDFQGTLRSVQRQLSGDLATLVAELSDGTDVVDLVWLGRRSIAGIESGRTARVHGRVAVRDGHKTIYNPMYQLMSADV